MSKTESVDELLDGIVLEAYNKKRRLLIAGAKVILKNVGIRHEYTVGKNDDTERSHFLRRNAAVEHVQQSGPIVLHPSAADELGIKTNAVAIGNSEEWFATSLAKSYLLMPQLTSYYIWPLFYGDNVSKKAYQIGETEIFIDDYEPEIPDNCLDLSVFEEHLNAVADARSITLPSVLPGEK